jgi:hypothetical protein
MTGIWGHVKDFVFNETICDLKGKPKKIAKVFFNCADKRQIES